MAAHTAEAGSSTKVNLTVKLDKHVAKQIRILAAQRGTSISKLVAELIREKAEKRDDYEKAKKRALAQLEKGIPFEGPMLTREQMHERR
jgi:ribosomal protein S3